MTLIYRNVEVYPQRMEISFPEPSGIVPRKEAEKLSAKCLDSEIDNIENGNSEKIILDYARGKAGGCARAIKTPNGIYMAFPMKDWISGVGDVKYAADIQAGMTTEGQESRDAKSPWKLFSLGEGMEETTHWIRNGASYQMLSGTVKNSLFGEESRSRMLGESEILKDKFSPQSNDFINYDFFITPLLDRWDISENIPGYGNYEFHSSIAFTRGTGGIEVIPGIINFSTDYNIASETGEMDCIYSADTERGKEWLNRMTVHINIADGHTIAHKVNPETKSIDVVYNDYLYDALNGGLWDVPEKRKVAPAREKVEKVIEYFPPRLGRCNGLYPLIGK